MHSLTCPATFVSSVPRRAITPLLVTLQIVPKIAFAPLVLVWFGIGLASKVTIAFLIAFFPVLINTAVGRIKHRNIKKNPQVALAITEQGNPYKLVMIKGRVIEEVTGHVAEDHIDKMAKKYTGAEKYQNRRPGEKIVLLKIEPHHVSRMR